MRLRILAALPVIWGAMTCWSVEEARAGETVLTFGAGTVSVPVVSMKEARFKGVVRQEHDFSCGSAALATLLTHHYGRPTTERDAFESMYAAGNHEAIQRFGFSMADMQRYLASVGFRAEGYRVSLDKLAEVGIPAVTLINTHGYSHFVVIKGIKDGHVLVGDPAMGVKVLPRDAFEGMWQGVVFVIHDQAERARAHFNVAADWRIRPKAPTGALQGLATISVLRPGPFQF
jgi:Predicted double-glycine peptidase